MNSKKIKKKSNSSVDIVRRKRGSKKKSTSNKRSRSKSIEANASPLSALENSAVALSSTKPGAPVNRHKSEASIFINHRHHLHPSSSTSHPSIHRRRRRRKPKRTSESTRQNSSSSSSRKPIEKSSNHRLSCSSTLSSPSSCSSSTSSASSSSRHQQKKKHHSRKKKKNHRQQLSVALEHFAKEQNALLEDHLIVVTKSIVTEIRKESHLRIQLLEEILAMQQTLIEQLSAKDSLVSLLSSTQSKLVELFGEFNQDTTHQSVLSPQLVNSVRSELHHLSSQFANDQRMIDQLNKQLLVLLDQYQQGSPQLRHNTPTDHHTPTTPTDQQNDEPREIVSCSSSAQSLDQNSEKHRDILNQVKVKLGQLF